MNKATRTNKAVGIGDAAVEAKTGKNWKQWYAALDKAGAKKMTHKQIVAVVSDRHGIGPWWRQMVAVAYEQARGLRQKHEKPGGFEIGRSKTIAVPISRLYDAWNNPRLRGRWLDDGPLVIRKATRNKCIRITWIDGKTSVETSFYPKGDAKAQVTVQHGKLPNAQQGEKMKRYWSKALDRLRTVLEA
jgi:uncharacterized protein YndB with AHSA1/START domain